MPDHTQPTGVPTSPAEYYETQYCHSSPSSLSAFNFGCIQGQSRRTHLASHLFPAVPRGAPSSLLLGPVLYCPHSRSLGKCPARRYRFSVILQVSTKTFRLSSTGQLDNRLRARLNGNPQTGVDAVFISNVLTDQSLCLPGRMYSTIKQKLQTT